MDTDCNNDCSDNCNNDCGSDYNSNSMMHKKVCFMGYGNIIRTDDGVGPYIISQLEQKLASFDNFTFMTLHQIDLAFAPSLAEFDDIIFIDAAIDIDSEFTIDPVVSDTTTSAFSTHVSSFSQLLHIVHTLYNPDPIGHIVRVKGYEFGFGEKLSKKGMQAATSAMDAVTAYIGA